ncbi:MAG: 2-C-methyl-D-erythritol 2,4-cyclodiphosphate synthase [Actinobacteria bacterium]|nr:MAG: 2-C-methyl-D-erythritol 2,4-cyclodiphosphate synthase [Actinomycetota bacterium]
MTVVGIGYDVHRFAAGRRLVLGGVEVEHDQGLAGHSDADVLTHAIIDALLGAAGQGDIGQRFPDTDPAWKDADSLELLRTAVAELREGGYTPVHVDATVALEEPRLGSARDAMRTRLAQALGLPDARVNIKATTGEGLGFVGRVEGAAAVAVATVQQESVTD